MQNVFRLNKEIFELKSKIKAIDSVGFLKYISGDFGWSTNDILLYKKITELEHEEFLEAESDKTVLVSEHAKIRSRVLLQGEYVEEVAVWGKKVFLYTEKDDSLVNPAAVNSFHQSLHNDFEYKNLVIEYLQAGWEIAEQPCYDYDNSQIYYVVKRQPFKID